MKLSSWKALRYKTYHFQKRRVLYEKDFETIHLRVVTFSYVMKMNKEGVRLTNSAHLFIAVLYYSVTWGRDVILTSIWRHFNVKVLLFWCQSKQTTSYGRHIDVLPDWYILMKKVWCISMHVGQDGYLGTIFTISSCIIFCSKFLPPSLI